MGGADVLPGISNQALSAFAYRNCSHLPKILQSEIAAAYARDFPRDSAPTQIVTEHRRKGRYLDTRETAEQAWLMMQAHNWRTALVLAHGHHMPRAVAVCQKLGMSTAALPGLEHIPFCPGSEQFWTRNCWLWFPREVGAILHYWRLGWL
jgi:uncharacterized SAM-binding protein YcdF (DUF218 family)